MEPYLINRRFNVEIIPQSDSGAHRQEPGAGIQAFQLSPGEHGRRRIGPVGKNLTNVGRPLQCPVVHQEGDAVVAGARKDALHN